MTRAARFSSSDFTFLDTVVRPLSRFKVLHDGGTHLPEYTVSTVGAAEGYVSLEFLEIDPAAAADTLVSRSTLELWGFGFRLFVHGVPSDAINCFQAFIKTYRI